MWVSEAKQRCPQLLILPYEFEAYASAAEDMYRAVLALTPHVMGISCDECYADATGCGEPAAMATQLRAAIARATGARRRAFLAAPSLPRFLAALPCRAFLAALPCRAFLAARYLPSMPRTVARAMATISHASHGAVQAARLRWASGPTGSSPGWRHGMPRRTHPNPSPSPSPSPSPDP